MSVREEVFGDARLILGDCQEILPTLGLVDMVVTSPPYDGLRVYGEQELPDCFRVIDLCATALKRGAVMMWNVKDQTIDGDETGTSFRQALHAKSIGLRLHDTMIYVRRGVTFPDANRYLPAFEYMFIFSKGTPTHFFGIKDRPNLYAGTVMHGTDRQFDGSLTKKRRSGQAVPAVGLRYNWWELHNAEAGNGEFGGHPAPMPLPMAAGHIATWSIEGATVLDPFAGSGTSGVAALRLGRKFIGVEIEERWFDVACRRLDAEAKQPRLSFSAPTTVAIQQVLPSLYLGWHDAMGEWHPGETGPKECVP